MTRRLILLSGTVASEGCDITAASASDTDVQAAINSASNGQTVCIPAGDATWDTQVTVSGKYIHLKGAGAGRVEGISTTSLAIGTGSKSFTLRTGSWINDFTNGEAIRARVPYNAAQYMEGTVTSWNSGTGALQLNITATAGSGTYARWVFEQDGQTNITHGVAGSAMLVMSERTDGVNRVSDIRFKGGTGGDTASGACLYFTSVSSGKPCQGHDLRFSSNNSCRMFHLGERKGLLYRTYWDAGFDWDSGGSNLPPGYGIAVKYDSSFPGGNATWEVAPTLGAADTTGEANFYCEDFFATGYATEWLDSDDNAKVVIRYGVLDNSGMTSHGPDTSNIGNRHTECYNLLCNFNDLGTATINMSYWFYLRGGVLMFHNSTIDNITSSEWGNKGEIRQTVQNLRRNGGPYACWNSGDGGYPAPHQCGQGYSGSADQTEGCFYYSNSGTYTVGVEDFSPDGCGGGDASSDYIQENRDYFLRAPQAGDVIHPYSTYTYPHPARLG